MRKKISALMIGAVILSALLIPTVLAEKPTPVSGTWSWEGIVNSVRFADGNMFITATEYDDFDGTFDGDGVGSFTVTVHSKGFMTGIGRTTFTGEVMGKEGTLVIQWTGNTKTLGKWHCKWVILSGTGELANLRGSGIGVETAPDSYILVLSGKIHFDPS
jgi:hypothetical protein